MPCIGRFAPSPTGPLHFGSLIAALGSFLDARHHGGQWRVRIEDLDRTRVVEGAADRILRTLEAFGLEWDGPVVYQSRRDQAYRQALEGLLQAGLAYPCGCSRQQVRRLGRSGLEGPIYPGTCRNGLPPGCTQWALRLRTTAEYLTAQDRVYGPVTQHLESEVGDFVIKRADGLFAYQLAVVVDDAWQGVTHVVRGADLLFSTPRQVYLQRLLGAPQPSYLHLPLALDRHGRKLSKQSASTPVDPRRPAPALLAALAHLDQPLPEDPLDRPVDILDWATRHWDPENIQPRGVRMAT